MFQIYFLTGVPGIAPPGNRRAEQRLARGGRRSIGRQIMVLWKAYLDDMVLSFRKYKEGADKAIRQVESDDAFFHQPGEFSNSIAVIIKHVAGNLTSRWTDFLTTDGE